MMTGFQPKQIFNLFQANYSYYVIEMRFKDERQWYSQLLTSKRKFKDKAVAEDMVKRLAKECKIAGLKINFRVEGRYAN